MKFRKAQANLARRRKDWEKTMAENRGDSRVNESNFHKPGSMKGR